jgi:hypothetical protein
MALQENPDPRKYSTYLATRPAKFEEDAFLNACAFHGTAGGP